MLFPLPKPATLPPQTRQPTLDHRISLCGELMLTLPPTSRARHRHFRSSVPPPRALDSTLSPAASRLAQWCLLSRIFQPSHQLPWSLSTLDGPRTGPCNLTLRFITRIINSFNIYFSAATRRGARVVLMGMISCKYVGCQLDCIASVANGRSLG